MNSYKTGVRICYLSLWEKWWVVSMCPESQYWKRWNFASVFCNISLVQISQDGYYYYSNTRYSQSTSYIQTLDQRQSMDYIAKMPRSKHQTKNIGYVYVYMYNVTFLSEQRLGLQRCSERCSTIHQTTHKYSTGKHEFLRSQLNFLHHSLPAFSKLFLTLAFVNLFRSQNQVCIIVHV